MVSPRSKVRKSKSCRQGTCTLCRGLEWKFTPQLGRIELLALIQTGILSASKLAKTRGHREAELFDTGDGNSSGGRCRACAGHRGTAGKEQLQKSSESRLVRLRGEGQGSLREKMCDLPLRGKGRQENRARPEGDV